MSVSRNCMEECHSAGRIVTLCDPDDPAIVLPQGFVLAPGG